MLSLTTDTRTPYHRMSAGLKLAVVCVGTAVIFALGSPAVSAAVCGVVFGLYALPGTKFLREGLDGLRVLWPFLLLIALWHGLTGTFGTGIGVALQLLAAVGLANLMTLTTRLDDLSAVVERLAQPLRPLGARPERFGLAIALVIRFVPVLLGRGEQIMEAWRARSPKRPRWQVLAPIALSAIDDASQVAEALRARGGIDGTKE